MSDFPNNTPLPEELEAEKEQSVQEEQAAQSEENTQEVQSTPAKKNKAPVIIAIVVAIVVAVCVAVAIISSKTSVLNNVKEKLSITQNAENGDDTTKNNDNSQSPAGSGEGEQGTQGSSNGSSSKPGNDDDETSVTGKDELPEFSVGKTENNVYSNKFSNIKFILPDDSWSFSSYKDAMADIPGAKYDEELGVVVYDAGIEKSYFTAVATDSVYGSSVQFMLFEEKSVLTSKISQKEYVETTVAAAVEDKDAVKSEEGLTCKIGTDTYSRIDTIYDVNGVKISQTYLCKKMDKYYSVIILTTAADEKFTVINNCIAGMKNA